ncbi:hypothetical protein RRG08_010967 [Elysia crispata]|uniref:Uncharacterized protein n=1 Tax=Elysia crispata TaxID=231223 RepID=A0AAE0XW22_9GAST|nr:hypothetical protein RRG08_010967 [Elysia crispata]
MTTTKPLAKMAHALTMPFLGYALAQWTHALTATMIYAFSTFDNGPCLAQWPNALTRSLPMTIALATMVHALPAATMTHGLATMARMP